MVNFARKPMKHSIFVLSLAVLAGAFLVPSQGNAGGVDVFVGINLPLPGVVVGPPPVVVSAPPVVMVEPAPVVVPPRPVVVHSAPVVVHSYPVVIQEHRKGGRYKPLPPGLAKKCDRKYDRKWAKKHHKRYD